MHHPKNYFADPYYFPHVTRADTSWYGVGTFLWMFDSVPVYVQDLVVRSDDVFPASREIISRIVEVIPTVHAAESARIAPIQYPAQEQLAANVKAWTSMIERTHPTMFVSEREIRLYEVRRALALASRTPKVLTGFVVDVITGHFQYMNSEARLYLACLEANSIGAVGNGVYKVPGWERLKDELFEDAKCQLRQNTR